MFLNNPEQICQKSSEVELGGKWGLSNVFSEIYELNTTEACPIDWVAGWGGGEEEECEKTSNKNWHFLAWDMKTKVYFNNKF